MNKTILLGLLLVGIFVVSGCVVQQNSQIYISKQEAINIVNNYIKSSGDTTVSLMGNAYLEESKWIVGAGWGGNIFEFVVDAQTGTVLGCSTPPSKEIKACG